MKIIQDTDDTGWIDVLKFATGAVGDANARIERFLIRRIGFHVMIELSGKWTNPNLLLTQPLPGFNSVFGNIRASPGVGGAEVHIKGTELKVLASNTNGGSVNHLRYSYPTGDAYPINLPK